ncbi:FIG00470756: hypothetical protein [hydrothermal vent metagenome]|uniref:Uncharacterized protein n=1 Tax=hydrothermal vent metagenome TaxID=652676 RepID=A0A1W1D503_9ZZZZ
MESGLSKDFTSVVSVNPYENIYCRVINHHITHLSSLEYQKHQYVVSYINPKNFISAKISISKNIPNEDLDDAIYNKVYFELALDQAVEYKINYIESFLTLDDDERHFHVFIVDPSEIQEIFQPTIKQIKYIDIILPSPLLFQTLYLTNAIDTYGVHCFVYFQENDAFITIYNNKEYLYSKSIQYTLQYMHERFCELYGEQISYEEFKQFFSKENFRESDSDYIEYFIKLYKEIFGSINEVLTFVKRAYELEKIDHIYIDAQIATVTKFFELCEVELHIRSSDFDFNFDLQGETRYIDHLHALLQNYAILPSKERYECNFTLYERPPKFTKRESGKFIMLIAASLIIAFAYPFAYWGLSILQTKKFTSLEKEYQTIHKKRLMRQIQIAKVNKKLKESLKLLKEEAINYTSKKNTLMKIYKIQVGYPMKAKIMAELTKDFNKYGVQLEAISYYEEKNKRFFDFHLVALKDKQITGLIKYLTSKYTHKFNFTFHTILYDDTKKRYLSQLKVELL